MTSRVPIIPLKMLQMGSLVHCHQIEQLNEKKYVHMLLKNALNIQASILGHFDTSNLLQYDIISITSLYLCYKYGNVHFIF
jgi:hypothetical protein